MVGAAFLGLAMAEPKAEEAPQAAPLEAVVALEAVREGLQVMVVADLAVAAAATVAAPARAPLWEEARADSAVAAAEDIMVVEMAVTAAVAAVVARLLMAAEIRWPVPEVSEAVTEAILLEV